MTRHVCVCVALVTHSQTVTWNRNIQTAMSVVLALCWPTGTSTNLVSQARHVVILDVCFGFSHVQQCYNPAQLQAVRESSLATRGVRVCVRVTLSTHNDAVNRRACQIRCSRISMP